MGFGHTFKRVLAHGLKPKKVKQIRRKLGLTSQNRWIRSIRRTFGGNSVIQAPATSATTEGYHHNARTLSQLTGGV